MRIAKAAIDVGLHTTNKDAMLAFWQREIGLPFHETLPVGRGVHQLRHGIGESVLKINHNRDALAADAADRIPTPDDRAARRDFAARVGDPDGNRVTLVPPGHDRHRTAADADRRARPRRPSRLLRAHPRSGPKPDGRFRCGVSLLSLVHDAHATGDAQMRGIGYRYLTIQVFDVVGEHREILARGGQEGSAPVRLGDVAYISFVRDPDGNWIEISQRKSITGSLD